MKDITRSHRLSWDNNTKTHRKEIIWGAMDSIDLAQDSDETQGALERCNELSGSIKCWKVLEWLNDWWLIKKAQLRGIS
jgi:hypothetical protein